MSLTQGIHKISMEEYLADPCELPSLSSGLIHTLLFDTPAQAKHQHIRLNPDYQEKANGNFDIGTAAHSLFLEGIDNAEIIKADDWKTKAAREARDIARLAGRVPLLEKQYGEVLDMVDTANEQLAQVEELGITDLLKQGKSELTFIWQERETWCRIRPDWIADDYAITLNYKTTGMSPNPATFARTVISLGYDIADAFYRRGIKAVTGVDAKHIFMVQSTEPPYLCSFIGLPPEFQHMGEGKVIQGIDIWRHCLRTGDWFGYPKRVAWIEAPAYALTWQSYATFIPSKEDL